MAHGSESAGKLLWLFSGDATPDTAKTTDGSTYGWKTFRWELSQPITNSENGEVLPYPRRPMRVALTRFVIVTADDSPTAPAAPTKPYMIRVRCNELAPNNYMSGSAAGALYVDVAPAFLASEEKQLVVFERNEPMYADVNFTSLNQLTFTIEQREIVAPGDASSWGPLTNWKAFYIELRFI